MIQVMACRRTVTEPTYETIATTFTIVYVRHQRPELQGNLYVQIHISSDEYSNRMSDWQQATNQPEVMLRTPRLTYMYFSMDLYYWSTLQASLNKFNGYLDEYISWRWCEFVSESARFYSSYHLHYTKMVGECTTKCLNLQWYVRVRQNE